MLCAALTSILLQSGSSATGAPSAIERNKAFVARAKGMTVEYTVTDTRAKETGKARIEIYNPAFERFSIEWGGERFRYFQSLSGGISIRDDWKAYAENYALPRYGMVPETMTGAASYGYPMFMFAPSLDKIYPNSQQTGKGQESIRGVQCDKVTVGPPDNEGNNSTFWIDKDGRVLRWVRVSSAQGQTFTTVFDITKYEGTASNNPGHYTSGLPLGYVPYSIPLPRTRPVQTGEKAPLGSWLDVRRGSKVNVASNKPVAIVFTDPDCLVCAKIEPFLASLRQQLKAKGCSLVEVSLGTKRPNTDRKDKDRTVVWDSDGAIEAKFGTIGTPFFFVVDKEGMLVRGFQGYTKELEPKISQTLLSAFDPD